MDFDSKVIRQVRKYPSLYDANDWNYNNQELKKSIWIAITRTLCHKRDAKSVKKVRDSWNRLKNNFVRIYESSSSCPNNGRNKALRFLLPYIDSKPKRHRNFVSYEEPVDDNSMFDIDYSEQDLPVPVPVSKSKTSNKGTNGDGQKSVLSTISPCYVRVEKGVIPSSTEKKTDLASVGPEHSSKFVSKSLDFKDGSSPSGKYSLENLSTNPRALDSFFQGIADTVKSLDPVNQVLAQKHIANLVLDYKLREVDEKEDGQSKASDTMNILSECDSFDLEDEI